MASTPGGDNDAAPSPSPPDTAQEEASSDGAPRYPVSSRRLAAVEIPAVVKDIDRAVKAFGRVSSLNHVLDPLRSSLPFYMNPESPFCPSIMSHNARSHNIVLKITLPKRTGRKRRRGTDDPWQADDTEIGDAPAASPSANGVYSIARLDEPKVLRRKLADNADRYQVEAVGVIKHTHRFRGLADFYWDMSKSSFSQRYADQVLPGDIQQLKAFKFRPGTDQGPDVDIIPPPLFTHMSLPFNYNFSQNPYVRTTEDGDTINTTAVKQVGYFIGADEPAPTGPQLPPDLTDPRTVEIIAELEEAFQERPVWTRRSLTNHLGVKLRNWNELKRCLNYTAYQFKGGPWRDGVVPYGIDPRTDPKYRIYQTLMFKLARRNEQDRVWHFLDKSQPASSKEHERDFQSHLFDGESYCMDGKVWQVCDITDPLLRDLLDKASIRPTWDVNSGWYHGGLWAKVKAIMKTKLVAVRFGRHLTRANFGQTVGCGDQTPPRTTSATWHLPLPNLGLTNEEITELRGREPPKKKSSGYNVRVRESGRGLDTNAATEPSPVVDALGSKAAAREMGLEDGDSGSGGDYDGDDDGDDDDDNSDGFEYPDPPAYSDQDGQDDDFDSRDGEEEADFSLMDSAMYPELD